MGWMINNIECPNCGKTTEVWLHNNLVDKVIVCTSCGYIEEKNRDWENVRANCRIDQSIIGKKISTVIRSLY